MSTVPSRSTSGPCLYGHRRLAAEVNRPTAYGCHGRIGQRAFGAIYSAFASFPEATGTWTGEAPPNVYTSSPIAERGFCARCGTSISFRHLDHEKIDLAIVAYYQPIWFVSASNFVTEIKLGTLAYTRQPPRSPRGCVSAAARSLDESH